VTPTFFAIPRRGADGTPRLGGYVYALEPGDTLVVWRLDRLGRSMTHLVTLIQALLQRHVSFRSLSDGAIDTTTASGELVFHIFSALAQFERRLIQERTYAGLAVARARGKKGGRAPRRAEEPRVRMAYMMYVDQSLSVRDICRVLCHVLSWLMLDSRVVGDQ